MTRLVFAVSGMHCASCGLLIDDEVEELPDVACSTTDVRKGRTVVELANPSGDHATVAKAVTTAIAGLAAALGSGYTATLLD
jgi:copper chaperone